MPLGAKLVGNFKELAIGLEIFNLFNNNQNAITGSRCLFQNEYAIPNYMTTRVFNVVERQVVKSSAITFRQASVLLLKVSINVRTILKFITFEFILIAHHETFIYSLIELHCFTFS
jgi:hypothetical protein